MNLFPPHVLLLILFLCTRVAGATQTPLLDPGLSRYETQGGISGNLTAVGSDTLNNLVTRWKEGFLKVYPNVTMSVEGKGSTTAPPALIEGTAQIGTMSREMRPIEIDEFEANFGYKPTAVPVAVDGLVVFVHKDNPLLGITLQQLDNVFSSTYKRNGAPISQWEQLGLPPPFASRPLSLYGRNSASGTYGYFKQVVMVNGDYKASVKEQPGSSAVVQGVGTDLFGIGYSGVGYQTSEVRALALGGDNGILYHPTFENCMSGRYPLARLLYVYVNKPPNRPLDPLTKEFLSFVLSREGQEIVATEGYFPLPSRVAEAQRYRLAQ